MKYRYIKTRYALVNIEPHRPNLKALLGVRSDALRLDQSSAHVWLGWVPRSFLVHVRAVKIAAFAAFARILPVFFEKQLVKLPLDGDFAIERRPDGYKVFCFKEKLVSTLLPRGQAVDNKKIVQLRQLAGLNLGPDLLDWSLCGGWYTEQFIDGRRPTPLWESVDEFERTFLPYIKRLQTSLPPEHVPWSNYVEYLDGRFVECVNCDHPLFSYFQRTKKICKKRIPSNTIIKTVASHGDLTEKNLVIASTGTLALDWETFDYRSSFFDVFACFFSALVRSKRLGVGECSHLLARIENQITGNHLVNDQARDLYEEKKDAFYLFILEWLAMRAQHFLLPEKQAKERELAARMEQINEYINAFNNEVNRMCHPDTGRGE